MYILFINSGGKCDVFFSVQFNSNSNTKNCPTHAFNLTLPIVADRGVTHSSKSECINLVSHCLRKASEVFV